MSLRSTPESLIPAATSFWLPETSASRSTSLLRVIRTSVHLPPTPPDNSRALSSFTTSRREQKTRTIDEGCIDVPIARLESLCDGLLDFSGLGLPGAEADLGDLDAVVTGGGQNRGNCENWGTRGSAGPCMLLRPWVGTYACWLALGRVQVRCRWMHTSERPVKSRRHRPPPTFCSHGSRMSPHVPVHSQSKFALVRHGCECVVVCAGECGRKLWELIYRCSGVWGALLTWDDQEWRYYDVMTRASGLRRQPFAWFQHTRLTLHRATLTIPAA